MFSNVLKFAAAAAQESASIFDTAPLEVAQPAAGFVDSCMDWVGENKTAVIGVTAAVGVAVGAYYAWPWARDTIRGNRAGKRAPQPATAEAAPAATESARAQRTPEEIRADMEALIREAGEHLGKNPGAGKK